jgi:hypothetical protein
MNKHRAFVFFTAALATASACAHLDHDDEELDLDEEEVAAARAVTLNDLAILFPLPDPEDADLLLALQDRGARGVLLPRALFDQLPPIAKDAPADEVYAAMRVISVRFDPCFTGFDLAHGGSCQPQVRLQLQRAALIVEEAPGQFTQQGEAAIHLTYGVERREFRAIVRELVAARDPDALDHDGPLDIHPILRAEGLDGPYARELKRIVLRHAGASSLVRIAFTATRDRPVPEGAFGVEGLDMGHFDVRGGALVPRETPTTGGTAPQAETFTLLGPTLPPRLVITIDPEGQTADARTIKLATDTALIATATEAELMAAYDASLRVENPEIHGFQTVDCVVCHSGTATRSAFAVMRGIDPDLARPDRFTSSLDLEVRRTITFDNETNLMFGYKARSASGPRVSITQRVVNETAVSVMAVRGLRR